MDLILVYFVATLSLVFTNQVSDTDWQHGIVHNSFEFGDEHSLKTERTKSSTIVSSPYKERRSVNSDSSNLKLAAFNIQTFGTKKMATPGVPDILVKVGMLLQCFFFVTFQILWPNLSHYKAGSTSDSDRLYVHLTRRLKSQLYL